MVKQVGRLYSSIHAPKDIRLCINVGEVEPDGDEFGIFLHIYPDNPNIANPIAAAWLSAREIETPTTMIKHKVIKKVFNGS